MRQYPPNPEDQMYLRIAAFALRCNSDMGPGPLAGPAVDVASLRSQSSLLLTALIDQNPVLSGMDYDPAPILDFLMDDNVFTGIDEDSSSKTKTLNPLLTALQNVHCPSRIVEAILRHPRFPLRVLLEKSVRTDGSLDPNVNPLLVGLSVLDSKKGNENSKNEVVVNDQENKILAVIRAIRREAGRFFAEVT